MKFRKNKKGFTIVELVIVIAVIGILTAVMIPTIIHLVGKANKASDNALVSNLNKAALLMETENQKKPATMHETVEGLENYGYKLDALVAKSDDPLLYDLAKNQFLLDNAEGKEGHETKDLWRIQNSVEDQTYNIYAGSGFSGNAEGLTVGFDAGSHQGITSIKYVGEEKALIRSAGDLSVVEINAPQADVDFYGYANTLDVKAVKGQSLHIYGSTNSLKVAQGHVKVEDTGIVFKLEQLESTASLDNSGYIAEAEEGVEVPETVVVGGDYEIDSLSRLESFRDAVNSGNDFFEKTVKLTKNIELKNGWKPIGEGNRAVVANNTSAAGTYFRGTFDGNNKTISNLNNKGFVPTAARLDSDKGYAYGLFALVGDGAVLKNLTLTEVAIDTTTGEIRGDSVGALLGYGEGAITISGITVEGSVKASDGVGGVAGRIYIPKGQSGTKNVYNISISNCVNSASVTAIENGGKAAGVLGMAGDNSKGYNEMHLSVSGCSNSGTLSTVASNPREGDVNVVCYVTISSNNGRASTYHYE